MKRLFLDCEFDGFNGPLLSMALVGEGCEFYEELEYTSVADVWVAENVLPVLKGRQVSRQIFQMLLQKFLGQFSDVEIIADWPDDFKYFCQMMITKPGYAISTPNITMRLDRSIKYISEVPHNALADARAIMKTFN